MSFFSTEMSINSCEINFTTEKLMNSFISRFSQNTLSEQFCISVTLRVCPPGQRSAIAVNYTACPTRLRASGPLVINERSNLLPAKARANSLSLVKLGSKASPDWGVHQCGLDEVSPAVSCVRIFPGERSGNTESVNDDREKKVEVEKFTWVPLNYASRNSSQYLVLLDQIVAWKYNTIHYTSVNCEERPRKKHYNKKKI